MTEKLIVEIGTSTADEIAGAHLLFGRKFDDNFDWIKDGTTQGTHRANTVTIQGVKSYVIIWHLSDQKSLCINAVAQLPGHVNDFKALIQAMRAIAGKVKAKAIEGVTVRRGMVECLKENGFIPAGVCMTCIL
jgi:hypothetical protein